MSVFSRIRCLVALHGLCCFLSTIESVQGVRLGESESGEENPIAGIKFTAEDKEHLEKILKRVPGELLEAVEQKGKSTLPETKAISCWKEGQADKAPSDSKDQKEYDKLVADGRCESAQGVNAGVNVSHASMLKFRIVAKLFKVQARDTVLDYGAGCGHQIDQLCKEHGCAAVGVDITAGSAKYAKKNLKHIQDYCVANHETMKFPDNSFDFILASGVVGHLSTAGQCTLVGKTLMKFLKPGGCAWIGGLGSNETAELPYTWQQVPEQTWLKDDCIKKGSVKGPWMMNDQYLFGNSVYEKTTISNMDGRENSYSVFFCKPTQDGKKAPPPGKGGSAI